MATVCCKTIAIKKERIRLIKAETGKTLVAKVNQTALQVVSSNSTLAVKTVSPVIKVNQEGPTKLLTACKVGPPGPSGEGIPQINTLVPVGSTVELQTFPTTAYWAMDFVLVVTDGVLQRRHNLSVTNTSQGVCYTRSNSVGDIVPHNLVIGDNVGNMSIAVENIGTLDLKTSLKQIRSQVW